MASGHRAPHLVAILVGNDGASQTYVGHKENAAPKWGFRFDGAAPRRSDQRSLPARRNRQTEQRSRRGRIHRTIAPAETHLGTKSDRSDRPSQRRGRFPSGQHRTHDLGPALVPARHAGRHPRAAQTLRYRNLRQELRRYRPQQHSRPSDRKPALAKRLGLHRYDVPQPHQKPEGGGP